MKGSGPAWGEGAGGKINVRTDPFPLPPGSSVNNLECFVRKQKLKIECNFQFSNFRLPPKKGKLSYAPDCNIVGEAKLPLSLILLIVDRIKVKICVMFQYSTKRKKSNIFDVELSYFFWQQIKKIKNWHQFSMFDFKRKLNGRMTHGPLSLYSIKSINHSINQSITII